MFVTMYQGTPLIYPIDGIQIVEVGSYPSNVGINVAQDTFRMIPQCLLEHTCGT